MLQKVPYLDGFVYIDPKENIGQHVNKSGVYEPNLIRIVTECMMSNFDFVDIGANIGLHTLAAGFATVSSAQTLTAFEPEPEIHAQLVRNCTENKINVQFQPIGLSNKTGELTLYKSTDHNAGAHSFVHRANTTPAGSIPVKTLDLVFSDSDRARPTLIKIDVEGFENQVLQGGQAWLKLLENSVLLIEITPDPLNTDQVDGSIQQSIIDHIDVAGFSSRIIIDDTDTFDEYGHLHNDYFNIACWKGKQADAVMNRLIPELAIKSIPHNAADFVDWSRYSSIQLGPSQSQAQLKQAKLFAQLPETIGNLESQLAFTEFEFTPTLAGKFRKLWYSLGAKWGIRYQINKQEMINRQLIGLIKTQQAELERLRKMLDS